MNPSIVVLADLSVAAEKTARYAAVLAAPLHAHVTLLHLYHNPVLLAPELAMMTATQINRNYDDIAAGLETLAQLLPCDAEVIVSTLPMHDAVVDAIQQQHPLLLAMGLSPEQDFLDELQHNQVLPVLRATHQPLLLVPEAASTTALPRRVLLALDAEPFSLNEASKNLAPVLATWQAAYTVTHVVLNNQPTHLRDRLPLAGVRACGLLPPNAPLWLYQEADEIAADGILQALADTQADLLVLIARPRSFLGRLFHHSVTADALRRSPVPVLLVSAEAPALPDWMPTMS